MAFENYIKNKKVVVFGLDNVLYPEKDYLLQVYYLFSEFISYQEQINAKSILDYMTTEFSANGAENIFQKTASKFNIPLKYDSNFILLHETARLPLKLLLFKHILSFLQELVLAQIHVFLLIDGKPEIQINKIKQLEWNGLEQYLNVYFSEEFESKPSIKSLEFIIDQNELIKDEILIVGNLKEDELFAKKANVDFLSSKNLFN